MLAFNSSGACEIDSCLGIKKFCHHLKAKPAGGGWSFRCRYNNDRLKSRYPLRNRFPDRHSFGANCCAITCVLDITTCKYCCPGGLYRGPDLKLRIGGVCFLSRQNCGFVEFSGLQGNFHASSIPTSPPNVTSTHTALPNATRRGTTTEL